MFSMTVSGSAIMPVKVRKTTTPATTRATLRSSEATRRNGSRASTGQVSHEVILPRTHGEWTKWTKSNGLSDNGCMRQVNIHEAKTHFSELIAAVERGEEIIIARRGKPVAKLESAEPAERARRKPRFGLWKGKINVDPSFYDPMSEEELAEWHRPIEGLDGTPEDKVSKST